MNWTPNLIAVTAFAVIILAAIFYDALAADTVSRERQEAHRERQTWPRMHQERQERPSLWPRKLEESLRPPVTSPTPPTASNTPSVELIAPPPSGGGGGGGSYTPAPKPSTPLNETPKPSTPTTVTPPPVKLLPPEPGKDKG